MCLPHSLGGRSDRIWACDAYLPLPNTTLLACRRAVTSLRLLALCTIMLMKLTADIYVKRRSQSDDDGWLDDGLEATRVALTTGKDLVDLAPIPGLALGVELLANIVEKVQVSRGETMT